MSKLVSRSIEKYEKAEFGFWLYLMTDIILFASLFATYMILRNNVAGGETGAELFDPKFALAETIILLLSSFTCGLAVLFLRFKNKIASLAMLVATLLLGLSFITLELYEFMLLTGEGQSWRTSAFLSAFFTLVGTHGFHILVGLLWCGTMILYVAKNGTTRDSLRKMTLFSLFWHFLDLVWIFIFTIVYLGASL